MMIGKFTIPLLAVLSSLLSSTVQAHMQLWDPAPLGSHHNPYTIGEGDYKLQHPYNCCGEENPDPCRGHLNKLGTEEGKSVKTWKRGTQVSWSSGGYDVLEKATTHYGGSAQVGLSSDKGQTFKVLTSYQGNHPHRNGEATPEDQTFQTNIPSDAPLGENLFAWIWVNREQEFFFNCAVVTITDESGGTGDGEGEGGGGNTTITMTSSLLPSASAVEAGEHEIPSTSTLSSTALDTTSTYTGRPMRHSKWWRNRDTHPNLQVRKTINRTTIIVERQNTVSWNDRPTMFFANWKQKTNCLTPKTTAETKYPNPGPDVVTGDGEYPLELPTC